MSAQQNTNPRPAGQGAQVIDITPFTGMTEEVVQTAEPAKNRLDKINDFVESKLPHFAVAAVLAAGALELTTGGEADRKPGKNLPAQVESAPIAETADAPGAAEVTQSPPMADAHHVAVRVEPGGSAYTALQQTSPDAYGRATPERRREMEAAVTSQSEDGILQPGIVMSPDLDGPKPREGQQ